MGKDSALTVIDAIQQSRKFFTVDNTPIFKSEKVGLLLDRLYEPVWDFLFDNKLLKDDDYDEDEFIASLENKRQINDIFESARYKDVY